MFFNQKKALGIMLGALIFSQSLISQEPENDSDSEDFSLPPVITFIDGPAVEQRQVFSRQEIESFHSESLTDFLQSAGIQILSYGTYGLESKPSIRGFTDETVRVIIDGICVNNAQYGTFDFSAFNLKDAERIEIIRGGFSEGISDEGAVGGAIYITTKKQSLGHSFYADSSVKTYFNSRQPFDTFENSFGWSGQLSDCDFIKLNTKLVFAENRFQFTNSRGKVKTRENSEVTDGNLDLKFSHFFSDGINLTLGESFYGGKKNCPGKEFSNNSGLQTDYDNRLNLSFFIPSINNAVKLESNLAWQSNLRFYEDKLSDSSHNVQTFTGTAYAELYKFDGFNQKAGFTFDGVFLDSTDDGNHVQLNATFKETSVISLNDVFSVSVPLAVKFCGSNAEFIPKLGFKASFNYVDFMLNGYRMVQFPNMDDLYWESGGFKGNPDLAPENGWGTEFTVNAKTRILPFSLALYTNYYENKIQWSSLSGTWKPENVASAFYAGANLFVKQSLFAEKLTLSASAEYLYTALLDESNDLTYKKRIMWTPDFVCSSSATLNLNKCSLSVEHNYIGKRYTSNLNVSYLEPYSLVNFSAELKVFDHIKPYVKVNNLTGTKYQSVEDYPMPGISLTGGISAAW